MNATLLRRATQLGLLGFTTVELAFIYGTMEELRPDLIVEWGTNVGHSARVFHEARKLLGLDCEIHSVDIAPDVPLLRPEEKEAQLKRGHFVRGCRVKLHVGDGATVACQLIAKLKPERPLLFIDDDHTYEHVLAELALLAEVCPHAVLLMHDTMLNRSQEPDRALRRFLEMHPDYSVTSVVSGQSMVRLWPL